MLRLKSGQQHTGSPPIINMTPMIDMVFLLLIFFLLTSIFVSRPVLDLTIPEAANSTTQEKGKEIRLFIRRGGEIEIDREEIALENLATVLRTKVERDQKKTLFLSADQDIPFRLFVRVLDVAQGLDLSDLAIVTQSPEGKR
ncbi:MAG: ExbD/TolR family protein [Nitrospiria bacterium]